MKRIVMTMMLTFALAFMVVVGVKANEAGYVVASTTYDDSPKQVTVNSTTYNVVRSYTLYTEQAVQYGYQTTHFSLTYADMTNLLGEAVTADNLRSKVFFPAGASNYATKGDNWHAADGNLADWNSGKFFIQYNKPTNTEFEFETGQSGNEANKSKVGDAYTCTFYMLGGSNAIEFRLYLNVVGETSWPTNVGVGSLNIVHRQTVDINFYPMDDGWAYHSRGGLAAGGNVPDLLGMSMTNFSADMMYVARDQSVLTNSKNAYDNKGFWTGNSDGTPEELYRVSSGDNSKLRIFVELEGFYWENQTLEIGFGQKPLSCTSGTYTVKVYMLSNAITNRQRKACEFTFNFNLQPATIDENADYTVEHADITEMKLTRTLKAGMHNTIVLPFKLTQTLAEQMFGSGTTMEVITEYADRELKTETTTEVEAHQPFLLIPTSPREDKTYLINCTQGTKTVNGNAGTATFTNGSMIGTYAPIDIEASTTAGIANYVISNDRFYLVSSDAAPMKGTRAYLQLNIPAEVKSVIGFAEGDEPTGIVSIENGKLKMENDGAVYDLQGRKMTDNSQFSTFNFQLKQGLYIVNGKKVLR